MCVLTERVMEMEEEGGKGAGGSWQEKKHLVPAATATSPSTRVRASEAFQATTGLPASVLPTYLGRYLR